MQVKGAVEAVPKLHKASIQTRMSGKGASSGERQHLWARQLKGEGSMVKKWRVIMRNLPFNVLSVSIFPTLSSTPGCGSKRQAVKIPVEAGSLH